MSATMNMTEREAERVLRAVKAGEAADVSWETFFAALELRYPVTHDDDATAGDYLLRETGTYGRP